MSTVAQIDVRNEAIKAYEVLHTLVMLSVSEETSCSPTCTASITHFVVSFLPCVFISLAPLLW
ncbi:hypothetical protein BDQ17DRAFT_1360774 [Cyathus striatus]|nr:hypothetical protein BDQ17DRAFT_1360774 [Cyathus striatus]